METIQQDKYGLWTIVGGWVARPFRASTHKAGQKVDTYHFGGTVFCGVGKAPTAKKGQYAEIWTTTRLVHNRKNGLLTIGEIILSKQRASKEFKQWRWRNVNAQP